MEKPPNEPTEQANGASSPTVLSEESNSSESGVGSSVTSESSYQARASRYPCKGCGNILTSPTETCSNCNARGIDPRLAIGAVAAVFCIALGSVFLFPKDSHKAAIPAAESIATPTPETSATKTSDNRSADSQDSSTKEAKSAASDDLPVEENEATDDRSKAEGKDPLADQLAEAPLGEDEKKGEIEDSNDGASQSETTETIAKALRMADAYYSGSSVPRDREKALKLYLAAGQLGNIPAIMQAAKMYETGDGIPRNDRAASQLYFTAAELGDAVAQNRIGLRLIDGVGMGRSVSEAIKWLSKAAEQGLKEAQYNLGMVYFRGDGVETNMTEAHRLLKEAAEAGHPPAALRLGEIYSAGKGVAQDADQAIHWLQVAVDGGISEAKAPLFALKVLRAQIGDGGPQIENLRRSALAGARESMFNLAVSYDQGKGVKEDKKEARYWYSKAAMANLAQAQHNLGIMLLKGEGGYADRRLAYAWLRIAKENGSLRANEHLKRAEAALSAGELQEALSSYESIKRSLRSGRFDD